MSTGKLVDPCFGQRICYGGRGSYQSEASRFVLAFWEGGEGYNGGDQDYDRPRGNGLYRPKGAGKTVTIGPIIKKWTIFIEH
ncbi:hypothetical protein M0R45_005964 [Rubus argutus]|uniref:Uncharacterized protein n=1 Tax=Rubus argutus TaxID=59490 RepID=A0AAW1YPD8_RUBAR